MILLNLCFLSLVHYALAYTPGPRWGQAVALINDALYVHGGKTDESNAYSYTSAPTNNDLLYLNLSSSFSPSSPPWELIGGAQNASSSQGPPVAWHTLSGLNSSYSLLFGGFPATNSDPVLITRPDSSWLFQTTNTLLPRWQHQELAWAEQPPRRIHHSAVTVPSGHVFVFGGELADGSERPCENYIYNPYQQTFASLPAENAPLDITGHTSLILDNGTVIIFGGYSTSATSLYPLSTIWSIDTGSKNITWNRLSVSPSSLPTPRRGFAATVVDGDKVLIHGGSDASYLDTYSDGWILDLSSSPGRWTQVDALSELGPRRDHFAVTVGSLVLFGFGYGTDGPADSNMVIFDASSDSFESSYTPLPPTQWPTQTMPGQSQAGSPTHPGGGPPGTVKPTSTLGSDPNDPNGSGGNGGSNGNGENGDGNGNGGGSPADDDDKSNNKKTTAIAVGTTLGILGALAAVVLVVWYVRRNRYGNHQERRFTALNNALDDEESPHSATFNGRLPIAGGYSDKDPRFEAILKSIGLASAAQVLTTRRTRDRRDMLADEDTRMFAPAYERNNESSWSLRSILNPGRRRSREPSGSSLGGMTPWREKNDPFSDGASLVRDVETGLIGAAVPVRPTGRRDASHASSLSTFSYVDPFADPEEREELYGRYRDDIDDLDASVEDPSPTSRHRPNDLQLQTTFPFLMGAQAHALSPVTEASRLSSDISASVSTHTNSQEALSPFDSSSRVTSRTSYERTRSPRVSSAIDSAPRPMKRSDSWWNRFSRTSFLDRRNSGGSTRILDFRDPNPPPRLLAIEESSHSTNASPESAERGSPGAIISRHGTSSWRGSRVYGTHGKSASSLRTANSEAIERMGGMDVVQRLGSGSTRTRDSTATSLNLEEEDDHNTQENVIGEHLVMSPVEGIDDHPLSHSRDPKMTPPRPVLSTTSSSSSEASRLSAVAARVQEFERRMTQQELSPPPTNTKKREERSRKPSVVNYGLVPKASLFVANPDHRAASSG